MKFIYEYRTKDNAVHSGVVCASTRDDAYATLKTQGIRPSRLVEAPGVLNKLFGKGKRWIAICVLCALLVAVAAALVGADRRATRVQHEAQSAMQLFDAHERRQIVGDTTVIEKGIRTGWADVFASEGDRFLASFAVPGVPAGKRNTTENEIRAALGRRVSANATDSIESRQIKAIVSGMKEELRTFLSKGGSIAQYGRLLVQRQEEEIGYYNRANKEIDTAVKAGKSSDEIEQLWEANNARLRKLGIKLVPIPE